MFRIGTGPRLSRGFKRARLPTTFTSTTTQRIEGVAGTQATAYLPTYRINAPTAADASQAQPAVASAYTIDHQLLRRAELWLAEGQAQNAAIVGPSAAASAQFGLRATNKYVCNFLRYDQMIRNMSLQDVEVTLYDCVLRSSVVPNFVEPGVPSTTPVQNRLPDPMEDWEAGLLMERGPATQSTASMQTNQLRRQSIGTTPFQSTVFTKLYRVSKVTKVTLSAGEVHHHHINVRPRNMFDGIQRDTYDSSLTISASSRGSLLPGLSGFTILVATGAIVNNKTTKNLIATSAIGIDVVTKCSGSFSSYTREHRQHLQFDGFPKDLPPADYQGVQDDDGEIVPDVQA